MPLELLTKPQRLQLVKGRERIPDTPPTSPVSRLIEHFQAMVPTQDVSTRDKSSQTSSHATGNRHAREGSYGDGTHRQTISPHSPNPLKGADSTRITKTLEPNMTSFMTSGHDSAMALFNEVGSEVKLDTFDKLTRETKIPHDPHDCRH